MKISIVKWSDFKTSTWSGGTTSEIIIVPEGAEVGKRNFNLRISTATCDLDESVFSDYTGYKRYIAPVDGELVLDVEGSEIKLNPYEVYEFNGSDAVTGYSKVRDYNLIFKEGLDALMESFVLRDIKVLTLTSKNYLIQSFDSDIRFETENESGVLNKNDALLIENANGFLKLYSEVETPLFLTQY